MSDAADFLHELARQIKRHPQSYPTWLAILADDVIETKDNVDRRRAVEPRDRSFGDPDAIRRFFAE